tara:strand:- start:30889 stop:31050 length:162 start_codon:yes stop_codon:yes gene_type:complete
MKRYVLDVKSTDDGELYVELPDDLTEALGWTEGDTLEYNEDEYGTLNLEKIDD